MSAPDPSRFAVAHALRAMLAALTLVAALGEVHLPHEMSSDLGGQESVAVDARHVRQEAHLESSEIAVRPHCPACLLQRQPLDRPAADARAVGLPLASRQPGSAPGWTATGVARGPSSPRAPPLS